MRKVTFKGNPLTLVGRAISVGNAAANFKVVNGDLKEISLSDVKGKIKIITSFPSRITVAVLACNPKSFSIASPVLNLERDSKYFPKVTKPITTMVTSK